MDLASVAVTAAGACLVLVVLLDIFLTALFPASGHGPLREPLSRWSWRALLTVARRLSPQRRRRLLAYSGPLIISQTIIVWLFLLVLGWALIYLPTLGAGIVAAQGRTNDGLATALYVSGFTITTLGTGDIVPVSAVYRLLVVLEAAVGFSVFTLVLTYFLSTYGAITRRRTFGSELEQQTFGTGSAARLLTGLAGADSSTAAGAQLGRIAAHLTAIAEAHTSYPVLGYFHFAHEKYALPRMLLVSLEVVALARSALSEHGAAELVHSSSLSHLEQASHTLVDVLATGSGTSAGAAADGERVWRNRFLCSVGVLAAHGVTVVRDTEAGARRYAELRCSWDGSLRALSDAGGYDWDSIQATP
jgi:hypothetical protein